MWMRLRRRRTSCATRAGMFAGHQSRSIVFALLRQQKRPCPRRLSWAFLLKRDFGKDPTIDRLGQPMRWTGQLKPRTQGAD